VDFRATLRTIESENASTVILELPWLLHMPMLRLEVEVFLKPPEIGNHRFYIGVALCSDPSIPKPRYV
jgi:hypothetical protein